MTSLAQSFAEARDHARKGGEYLAEGCGWSPELLADMRAFDRDLAEHRDRIATAERELADIRARLGGGE